MLRNNLACLQYGEGDHDSAADTFSELARDDVLALAHFNHGVYLDEIAGDPLGAFEAYSAYLERGGPAEDEAQRFVDDKIDVFGFGGGR